MPRFTGQSIERVEDPRFLTGADRFVSAIDRPGLLHVAFVRSQHAHGRLQKVDASAALDLPGVVAVLTADDLAFVQPQVVTGPPGFKTPPVRPLATDKVRYVGDPIAVVVAETPALAADGRDAVVVDVDPLPAVVRIDDALAPGSPPIFEDLVDNVVFRDTTAWGPVDDVFGKADLVVSRSFTQHRISHAPLESRGGVASYEPVTCHLEYEIAHKRPHSLRMAMSALLGIPFGDIHVVARDIGGAFGSKGQVTREDVAVCAAAKLLGRAVKWVEERSENLLAAGHARDETLAVDAAVTRDGGLLGIRARMVLDQGAYPMPPFPSSLFPLLVRTLLPGAYKLEAYSFETTIVATNKASYISYRGPWVAETWVRDRMLDEIARELGLPPEELRRRNLVGPADQPTRMLTGPSLARVTALETFERAVELADLPGFRERQRAALNEGRHLGVGFSTYIEPAPGPADFSPSVGFDLPSETAWARLEPTGDLTVTTWQVPHGQGHETTLAQVAADELGVPLDRVRIAYGDSAASPFTTMGTGGSRSATMGAGSAIGATRMIRDLVVRIAAHMLEAAEADLAIVDGTISVRGTPARSLTVADVARAAWFAPSSLPDGMRPGLEAVCDFRVPEAAWSMATHCCFVEVDIETGEITIPRYVVVEDCGELINPAIVDGQIRGGVAQGIAAVLYEHHVYDDGGQLLTSTLADYLVPAACDLPDVEIDHLHPEPLPPGEVPFRGVGEGGFLGAPGAVTNAVADALAPLGVQITEQHLPPLRVRQLIEQARGQPRSAATS
ncbi:MAG TPA: xanthine dehydrogenase family protein molybdopterin-binding subunit [Acidimicrobiia bacterium]|nr:xanthine dehydrogenase family protein molybdopterin-binding subunit [Acidimicrobiia bacterium]